MLGQTKLIFAEIPPMAMDQKRTRLSFALFDNSMNLRAETKRALTSNIKQGLPILTST